MQTNDPRRYELSAEPDPRQGCSDRVLVEGGRVVWVAEPVDSFGVTLEYDLGTGDKVDVYGWAVGLRWPF